MRGAPVDRISNLPSDILDNILKFLPVRDAVKTSILARKWRYQWVTMPHLVFDEKFYRLLTKNFPPEAITSHILSLHKGAVTKFEDCYVFSTHPRCFDQWLFFLSDRHLEDLALSCIYKKMPLRLFDFKQLKHLSMDGFEICELPPTFDGFTSLVKLELLDFSDSDGRLGKFLSKCPMLEYLHLRLNVMVGLMEQLPKDLDRLTVLKLDGVLFGSEGFASCVLSLITSSPNLQRLDIFIGYHEKDAVALEYLKAQHEVHVYFSCLEHVKINGMIGSSAEMEFIKILLMRSVRLRTLKVDSVFDMRTSSLGMKMLKKLGKAPRVSQLLTITFTGTWENL